MAMSRADMLDEVRFNIKRKVEGYPDARINVRLNWAQDYLADLHTYEEMRKNYTGATVNTHKRYGFPTRMKDIYSMTLQDGASSKKLTYVPARLFDRMVPRPEVAATGSSNSYVDYGINFELYKIPNDAYVLNLRCSIYPPDFSVSTATSALTRKDNLIVSIATVFCFQQLRELEDAAYWGAEMVPPLFEASLTSDHSAVDWNPVARGFQSGAEASLTGEWWTNPFTGRNVPGV